MTSGMMVLSVEILHGCPFLIFFGGGLKGHNNFIASNNVKMSTVMGLYCF